MNFGKCFETALEEQELSYQQAADILDVSKQRVAQYVNSRYVNTKTLTKIAKKLGYSDSDFIKLGE